MKKYTWNQLIGQLGNGKSIRIILEEQKEILYKTYIEFFKKRLAIEPNLNYKYILVIEKCDARYTPGNCPMIIDTKLEFNKPEEIVDYLVDNKFIKKEDLIKE
ncbi:hypothetical protein JXM83_02425 [Candidatus Woesearchaeota archaeon]|nr:hypothetical protein [Candidatus Woesearchaeota archaeon]